MRKVGYTRALVGLTLAGSAFFAIRCADVARGLGSACIRDEDCMSGYCAGSMCVQAPTLFDSGLVDATMDSGVDAPSPMDAHHGSDGTSPSKDTGAPHPDAPSHKDGEVDAPAPPTDGAPDHSAVDGSHDGGDAGIDSGTTVKPDGSEGTHDAVADHRTTG